MAGISQPFEEAAGLLELLGPGALGKIAGNDDQVGPGVVNPLLDRLDQPVVMSAEVKIGKMRNPGHVSTTIVTLNLFQGPFS